LIRRITILVLCVASAGCGDAPFSPHDGGNVASDGSASGSDGGTNCGTMAGVWDLTGMCGADRCEVSQTGCSLHILCNESIDYTGTVTGTSFTYSGHDGMGNVHTCSGMIQGTSYSGTCTVTNSGSCTFSATPH
jgi:hypothetical protein